MISKRARILAIVASDTTFRRKQVRGEDAWVGKCIHCNAALVVSARGETFGGATVEHIVPRCHGGGDGLENLALACARCNAQKGVRIDARSTDDATFIRVVEALQARRKQRWRSC